ncbi:helix-turn-helix transcriptional regulator, partial [Streptomyces sp. NPDC057654]|uniref:helix-turn-helix domain-containing protein n=1 Tax=Streptomyces sp. NPDC057654 TaxID=3346196 RepID=UPI0036AEBFB3
SDLSDLGRRVVTISVSDRTLYAGEAAEAGPAARLSPREREVLDLVAVALSNRQIGARLGITEGTIKRHLRNIFDKLDAVSRLDAVNKALGGVGTGAGSGSGSRPWAASPGAAAPEAAARPVARPPAPVLARNHAPVTAAAAAHHYVSYSAARFPANATARRGGDARREYADRER